MELPVEQVATVGTAAKEGQGQKVEQVATLQGVRFTRLETF
jgi:hypothetical protein